jgi:hypothetical protein
MDCPLCGKEPLTQLVNSSKHISTSTTAYLSVRIAIDYSRQPTYIEATHIFPC